MAIREPHRSFLAAAHAPLPPLPDIKLGPGPAYKQFSYYDPDADTVWLLRTDWHSRFALFHELGHVFDRKCMTDTDRDVARGFFKARRPWRWGKWNPLKHLVQPLEEFFADDYANACRGAKVKPGFRAFLRRCV